MNFNFGLDIAHACSPATIMYPYECELSLLQAYFKKLRVSSPYRASDFSYHRRDSGNEFLAKKKRIQ